MSRKPRASQLGVTPADYEVMLAGQDGHCALCPSTPKTRRLHVDHNHRTGVVRGLLCFGCNRTLPYYKDSDWLSKAASYVARFEEDEHVPAAVVDSREAEILDLRAQGMTLQEIATRYSISRQRVHQIVQGEK